MAYSTPTSRSTGDVISASIWNQDVVDNMIAMTPHGFTAVIDGSGAPIVTGVKFDIYVPAKCTITKMTLLADQTGSIVIDLWKDTYANFPPTDADSITSTSEPEINAGVKYQDESLTDWVVDCEEGDIIRVNVDSCSTITRCILAGNVAYS